MRKQLLILGILSAMISLTGTAYSATPTPWHSIASSEESEIAATNEESGWEKAKHGTENEFKRVEEHTKSGAKKVGNSTKKGWEKTKQGAHNEYEKVKEHAHHHGASSPENTIKEERHHMQQYQENDE